MILLPSVLLMLIFSCIAICGFYKISRHTIVVMPNEKLKSEGYVLKWWSEFFEQTSGLKSYQYSGDQLEQKLKTLAAAKKGAADKLKVTSERFSLEIVSPFDSKEREFVEDILQVRTQINGGYMFLFLDEYKYRFPKWVRMVYSQCHVCMASPVSLGGLSWLAFVKLFPAGLDATPYPLAACWLGVIPYCIALSFLNYIVGKWQQF